MPAGRPRTKTGPHNNAPQKMSEKHKSIAMHAAEGLSQARLCEMFDLAPSTMSTLFSSPLFQALVEGYRQQQIPAQAKKRLRELSKKAVEKLDEHMDGENPFVSMAAVKTVLAHSMTTAEADQKAETEAMKLRESKVATVRHVIIDAAMIKQMMALDLPDDVIDIPADVPSIPALLERLDAEERDE